MDDHASSDGIFFQYKEHIEANNVHVMDNLPIFTSTSGN